jgi:hypothetical protein
VRLPTGRGPPAAELNNLGHADVGGGLDFGSPHCAAQYGQPGPVQWATDRNDTLHSDAWCRTAANAALPRLVLPPEGQPTGLTFLDAGAVRCTNTSQLAAGLRDYNANGCPDEWEDDDVCDEDFGQCPARSDPDCGDVEDDTQCGAAGGGGFPCVASGQAFVAYRGASAASASGGKVGRLTFATGTATEAADVLAPRGAAVWPVRPAAVAFDAAGRLLIAASGGGADGGGGELLLVRYGQLCSGSVSQRQAASGGERPPPQCADKGCSMARDNPDWWWAMFVCGMVIAAAVVVVGVLVVRRQSRPQNLAAVGGAAVSIELGAQPGAESQVEPDATDSGALHGAAVRP